MIMGNYNYTHTCGRCATTLFTVAGGDGEAWKADAASGGHKSTCGACGCTYTTEDDGNPSGGVQAKDLSEPKIVSLDVTTGPIAGGTTVQLTGDAFQVPGATAVVKFGGLTAAPTVLDDTSLDAVTPAGKARLLVDAVVGSFTDEETITGGTSGATATLLSASGLWIQGPSGPFTAGEEITGGTSGATADLADPTWYDGSVDVTVENENGQRASGGSLAGAFEFTI
jgi:hypothetical protein